MNRHDEYIPALGAAWLTPFYDMMQKWVMQEERFKRDLVQGAGLQPGQPVLDLGCGTATLTLMLKQNQPDASLVGLDGDNQVLTIARAKSAQANALILFTQGLAFALPYPDQTFDRVVSSLVFHHLTRANKQRTFDEVLRVLRPGGELHIVDFGRPQTLLAQLVALFLRRFEQVSDNIDGLLPGMLRAAGLDQVEERAHYTTVFGTLTRFYARKPGTPGERL